MKPLIVFGCVVKWKAVAIRKEDIRFLSLENRIVRIADIYACNSEGLLCLPGVKQQHNFLVLWSF